MAEDTASRKTDLRCQLQAAVRALTPAEAARASAALRDRLVAQAAWQQARVILLFAPGPDEPDVWPLVDKALRAGHTVALPRHDPATDTYGAAQVRDLDADLVKGRFGLREPGPQCPSVPLNRLDLAVVPGLGFTPTGGRLGRGKGYFDRLLTAVSGITCGVAFDCQLVDTLPLEPHDAVLNAVLTPTQWIWTGTRARL
jgi:5-formyltetrahydrofolate cyclo-ligase